MLKIQGVSKIYRSDIGKSFTAVDNLSLDIKVGEVFGLLGPNGSGKTTTIKMILGLTKPTQGHITIDGIKSSQKESRTHMGYVPENPYFYSHLTGKELLEFTKELYGEEKLDIETVLTLVDMKDYQDTKMGKYSKGMLQRIGLAQALLHKPKILLLDEPMSGLDPIGRKRIKDIIVNLKKHGTTIILCSHILEYAETFCDRVGIMQNGKLLLCKEVKTLKNSLEETFIHTLT